MTSAWRSSTEIPLTRVLMFGPTRRRRLRRHRDRHDLLGEHVQGVARDHRRLDQALVHAPRHHRALQQVAAELREDAPAADLVHAVARPADALQARPPPTSATRSATPSQPRPCRCPAPASSSPRCNAAHPPSAAPPPSCAPRAPASRGGPARSLSGPRPGRHCATRPRRRRPCHRRCRLSRAPGPPSRSGAGPRAPPSGGCSRTRSSSCARARARRSSG